MIKERMLKLIRLTRSLEVFLSQHYKDLIVPLSFGHSELLTEEIWQEYLSWCQTDEAKPYMD